MNNTPEWFNIALLPQRDDVQDFVSMSSCIPDSSIELGKPHIPHLTIFQARFERDRLKEVEAKILEVLRGTQVSLFWLMMHRFSVNERGFVFIHSQPGIRELHDPMCAHLSPLRTPFSEAELHQLSAQGIPAQSLEDLRKYGMAQCYNRYDPHVTIAKVAEDRVAATRELLPTMEKDYGLPHVYRFHSIALLNCSAADGSATEILGEESLLAPH